MAKKTNKKSAPVKADEVTEISVVLPAPVNEPIIPTTIPELWALVDARLKAIEDKLVIKVREGTGRGPLSTRSMTEADATRIMTGDLKATSIKECAKTLGLSYGQIYSARGGYTFKTQYANKVAEDNAAKKK